MGVSRDEALSARARRGRYGRRTVLRAAGSALAGALAAVASYRRNGAEGARAMTVEDAGDAPGATSTAGAETYFPLTVGEAWETVSPAAAGWDAAGLAQAAEWAAGHNTDGLIVLHQGRILLEHYANEGGPRATLDIASAQKSVTSLLAGIAQEQGLLDIGRPASDWLGTGWSAEPAEKERLITVRHLLTMTSGTDDQWRYVADAGATWYYNNPAYHLAKRVLERATGTPIEEYTSAQLAGPIGLSDTSWQVRPRMLMPDGVPMTGLRMSTRDMARVGLLVLAGGDWDGAPVLTDTAYLRDSLSTSQPFNFSYGYLWWLNGKASHMLPGPSPAVREGALVPAAPPDMVAAMGANDNRIYIVPSLGLVVARQGRFAFERAAARSRIDNELWMRLMGAAPGREQAGQ